MQQGTSGSLCCSGMRQPEQKILRGNAKLLRGNVKVRSKIFTNATLPETSGGGGGVSSLKQDVNIYTGLTNTPLNLYSELGRRVSACVLGEI